jgi:hypothetical protein
MPVGSTTTFEKGKEFKPADATRATLNKAAQEAHEGFRAAAVGGEPWWPGTQWKLPESIGQKTGFSFQSDDALYIDNRGMIFFLAFGAPKKLGAAVGTIKPRFFSLFCGEKATLAFRNGKKSDFGFLGRAPHD